MLNFVCWPQPPAYFENLFVVTVAEQLSAIFLRCSLPSRCWNLNSAIFHSKITVFPRHWALWRPGSVLLISSLSLLALLACFHKALCPLTVLIILLVGLQGDAWISSFVIPARALTPDAVLSLWELEIQVLPFVTSTSVPFIMFFSCYLCCVGSCLLDDGPCREGSCFQVVFCSGSLVASPAVHAELRGPRGN